MRIEGAPPKDDPAHETDYRKVLEIVDTSLNGESSPRSYSEQGYADRAQLGTYLESQ